MNPKKVGNNKLIIQKVAIQQRRPTKPKNNSWKRQ